VLLDTNVTRELKNEGLARDIIRNVQNLRKEAGLDIADRIRLSLVTESETLSEAIKAFGEYMAHETLAVDVSCEPLGSATATTSVSIDGAENKLAIALERTEGEAVTRA